MKRRRDFHRESSDDDDKVQLTSDTSDWTEEDEKSSPTSKIRWIRHNAKPRASFEPIPRPLNLPPFLPTKNHHDQWVFWSIHSEEIFQVFEKHLRDFDGEYLSRYLLGEIFYERISDDEAKFDQSIFFQAAEVTKVRRIFKFGKAGQRIALDCKDVPHAHNVHLPAEGKVRRVTAVSSLAELMSKCVRQGDILLVFGDVLLEKAKVINLNSRQQHPTVIVHYRHESPSSSDLDPEQLELIRNIRTPNLRHRFFQSSDREFKCQVEPNLLKCGAPVSPTRSITPPITRTRLDGGRERLEETSKTQGYQNVSNQVVGKPKPSPTSSDVGKSMPNPPRLSPAPSKSPTLASQTCPSGSSAELFILSSSDSSSSSSSSTDFPVFDLDKEIQDGVLDSRGRLSYSSFKRRILTFSSSDSTEEREAPKTVTKTQHNSEKKCEKEDSSDREPRDVIQVEEECQLDFQVVQFTSEEEEGSAPIPKKPRKNISSHEDTRIKDCYVLLERLAPHAGLLARASKHRIRKLTDNYYK